MTHRIKIIIRMHPLQIKTFLRVVHCDPKTLGLDHLSVATEQNDLILLTWAWQHPKSTSQRLVCLSVSVQPGKSRCWCCDASESKVKMSKCRTHRISTAAGWLSGTQGVCSWHADTYKGALFLCLSWQIVSPVLMAGKWAKCTKLMLDPVNSCLHYLPWFK